MKSSDSQRTAIQTLLEFHFESYCGIGVSGGGGMGEGIKIKISQASPWRYVACQLVPYSFSATLPPLFLHTDQCPGPLRVGWAGLRKVLTPLPTIAPSLWL
jgi:hypothetical protein